MKGKDSIEYLAYLLDDAKKKGKDRAIVFLGAGVSVSAGIPLTHVIVRHIKLKFKENELIREDETNNYYVLMGCLTAVQRRDLFHYYVTREKVRLNFANVYLAQLLKLGYVDYIVTVNFDDLILKACTLFNFLPPVYDYSNIKTNTTSDLRTGSVIYLHGQYFGQWLLNEEEELKKVEKEIAALFNKITTSRTWIVVGYSGNDEIFNKIKDLGSFSSELYWVKNEFDDVGDKHVLEFVNTPTVHAHKIEGYYADSFFLKLHAELSKRDPELKAPDIFYKPFTYLKSIMNNVNRVSEQNEQSKETAELINNCNSRIEKAIDAFENKNTIETLKQNIIDACIRGEYTNEEAKYFQTEIREHNYIEANRQLAFYYIYWGNSITNLAKKSSDKNQYLEAFKKYQKASMLNPNLDSIYYNWGTAKHQLAQKLKNEKTYLEAFKKYQKASELNSDKDSIYYNWAIALYELAEQKNDENLYIEAFKKYQKASMLNPNRDSIYYNWGIAIYKLAQKSKNKNLYLEAFEKFQKVIELNPKRVAIYSIWGNALYQLAIQTNDENLYLKAFEKYQKANKLNPNNVANYTNWGNALSDLAIQTNNENLFLEAIEKYKKAGKLNPNREDIYYNWGTCLFYFARQKNDQKIYFDAFKKFQQANILSPNNKNIYRNWGYSLFILAKQTKDKKTFFRAETILKKGIELGVGVYNLACLYATVKDKPNALKYLEMALNDKEISIEDIKKDEDWDGLRNDADYRALLEKHK